MLQPQISVDERMEGAGVSYMSYEKHFLEHFHKACFNLLHEIVMRRALSIELEEHLVNQVLKVENIFSTLNNVSCPPVELNSTQLVC